MRSSGGELDGRERGDVLGRGRGAREDTGGEPVGGRGPRLESTSLQTNSFHPNKNLTIKTKVFN